MFKSSKEIHESYHQTTKSSSKIISDNNFTYYLLITVIKDALKNRDKSEILDIGCGAGSISFYLAKKDHKVTGIDISQKAVNSCIKTAKQLGIKTTEFIRTSFPENYKSTKKFDVVIFTEVIEHLPDDKKALMKIYQLLKNNGLLVLSTPSTNAPLHRIGLTKKFDKKVGHLRRYSLTQLKDLIKGNRFKIINVDKTEGILRNFLFVNPYAGKLIKYINHFDFGIVTFLDNISLKLFGESNYIIVARKVSEKSKKK